MLSLFLSLNLVLEQCRIRLGTATAMLVAMLHNVGTLPSTVVAALAKAGAW